MLFETDPFFGSFFPFVSSRKEIAVSDFSEMLNGGWLWQENGANNGKEEMLQASAEVIFFLHAIL